MEKAVSVKLKKKIIVRMIAGISVAMVANL